MACQGAPLPDPEEIDRALASVLNILKTEYQALQDIPPGFAAHLPGLFREGRGEAIAGLRAAIADVLFQRNCEDF